MNRRTALAASVSTVMVVGSVAVASLTSVGTTDRGDSIGDLAIGRRTTETIVRDEFVDDLVYQTSGQRAAEEAPPVPIDSPAWPEDVAPGGAEVPGPAAGSGDWTAAVSAPLVSPAPGRTGATPVASPDPPDEVTAPAPTSPTPSTSAPPTTWPPGTELPDSWPAGTPYPPMPPGCRKPHLEDDGRWNCDH